MVVTFPSELLGANFDVATLALVVPDIGVDQIPVWIGMNTLAPLYSQYRVSELSNSQPTAHDYKAVLKLLQICHHQRHAGSGEVVRLASKIPVLISAGYTIIVDGSLCSSMSSPGQWLLVEHPVTPLPGGLCIKKLFDNAPKPIPQEDSCHPQ